MSQTKGLVAIAAFAAMSLGGTFIGSPRVQAADLDQSLVLKGFQIAPVPLNLAGKDPSLVGFGSYIVNAVADCDGCHSNGPATQWLPGFNPYFGQQGKINPATYLQGGRDFGQLIPNVGATIISRNLTPDKTGRPAGGLTFAQFKDVLRNGTDYDHLHPTCPAVGPGGCVPPPFNGNLLQVMSWPIFNNMSDDYIMAIYEYLSAIPSNPGPTVTSTGANVASTAPWLLNACGTLRP